MSETEPKINDTESHKDKIRRRYKGINPDELDVIPAAPQINFYEDNREKRVAVYARVSTDDPRQTSSYELQKNHYTDVQEKYYLTSRACEGILRRASARGKQLPELLRLALEAQCVS